MFIYVIGYFILFLLYMGFALGSAVILFPAEAQEHYGDSYFKTLMVIALIVFAPIFFVGEGISGYSRCWKDLVK